MGEETLTVLPVGEDGLRITIGERTQDYRRADPPLRNLPGGTALEALGSFVSLQPAGGSSRLQQVWLWRRGVELWGVGIYELVVPGRRADFLTPVLLGRGVRDGEAYTFSWSHRGRSESARAVLDGDALDWEMTGTSASRFPRVTLEAGAMVRDEIMALAPRTSIEDWRYWFEVHLRSHFSSAEIPSLAETPSSGEM